MIIYTLCLLHLLLSHGWMLTKEATKWTLLKLNLWNLHSVYEFNLLGFKQVTK